MNKYCIICLGITGRQVAMDVIETDYSSHACLVSCADIAKTHYALFAWILNRQPDHQTEVVRTLILDINNNNNNNNKALFHHTS